MSGHLDGPPPGPPDPPYIPGDLGAPSAKEFARRRAGDRHMSDTIRLCVQTHHPIDPGPGSPGGREAMKHRGWADCDRAWRSWLASDEAVERVAGALAGPAPCHCSDDPRHTLGSVRCPQHGQGEWPRDRHRTAARAVLAALRGDGR